jgi:hypothetical protein
LEPPEKADELTTTNAVVGHHARMVLGLQARCMDFAIPDEEEWAAEAMGGEMLNDPMVTALENSVLPRSMP